MGNGTWVTVGVVAAAAGDVDGASGFTVCPPAAKKDDNSAPASVIVLVNIANWLSFLSFFCSDAVVLY